MENPNVLTPQEAKFCLIYVNAPAPYAGNALKCYRAVFLDGGENNDIEDSLAASEIMRKKSVKERIEELENLNAVSAASLRPRLTQNLLKIMDECSQAVYSDRRGTPLSPAALRAVSIQAMKTLNEMYAVKEDIAHKISLEGASGSGVTINIVSPQQASDDTELKKLIDGQC